MAENKEKLSLTEEVVKSDVAKREEQTLRFWNEHGIFKKTLEKDAPKGNYVFYDGPPFATGLPHYGHILASAIKDAVPRYQTMRGFHVDRKWGWDCHGLPIENIVEKELKISGKKQIEEIGIATFNEHARSRVLQYVGEWKNTIERIGRWVDFDGSYKTMDNSYIESVWWALKEIHGKNLIYESTKVLPYCPRCETPIANSEIAMDNSYKDITDISVYAKFKLEGEPDTYMIAWTTTPWTLPGNAALAVNPDLVYSKIKIGNDFFILAKDRLVTVKEPYEMVEEFSGEALVGRRYAPVFDYYKGKDLKNKENIWKVWSAFFVTAESGTGIVHIAPAFGEDDMNLAKEYNIPVIHHVGGDGKFKTEVTDFAGQPVKPKDDHQKADIEIIKNLAHRGLLFAKEKIIHSYPHCFRCETPLFYYAIPAWFIKISETKEKMLRLNEKINWIPEHLKEGRFKKSMEGAPDWNISRNRYWASPLPIWKCDACNDTEFLGSLADIKKKTDRGNEFYVMRHGEAESNVNGVLNSELDGKVAELTEKGVVQIKHSSRELKKIGIEHIIASPVTRTRKTALIAAQEIGLNQSEVVFDERIREVNPGEFNGRPIREYHAFFTSDEDRFKRTPKGGENELDIKRRMTEVLYELDEKFKGKKILIVTHDTPAWLLCAGAMGWTTEESIRIRNKTNLFLANAEVRKLEFSKIPHNADFELDFHRPYIDSIVYPCVCGKGDKKRIPEVIDCWFESGSMPFAQVHYPHENKEKFHKNFPAQFIAEYIAQTRTWFYYMHALSTMLFGSTAFENVVTTGTVLAEDGQKMSKSKGNFPDPWLLFNKYGVDPVRYYLLSSPVMKSEDLRFSEKEVDSIYKKFLLRLQNVLSFYELYKNSAVMPSEKSDSVLDQWILARLDEVVAETTTAMELYEIDRAIKPFDLFVDDLSTWYLRRSRDRLKEEGADKEKALATLRYVFIEFSKLLAPFTPFIAEDVYQRTKTERHRESVHLEEWPKSGKVSVKELFGRLVGNHDEQILSDMAEVRGVVSQALEIRSKSAIKVRQPLGTLTIKSVRLKEKSDYVDLIKEEVNVKEVLFDAALTSDIDLDLTLTPQLIEEGKFRDLLRATQELRKKEDLVPNYQIVLTVDTSEEGRKIMEKFRNEYMKTAGIKDLRFGVVEGGEEVKIDSLMYKLEVGE
jgi:isoleucyl-tRNA synthetase